MRVIGPDEIRRRISARAAIAAMRDAVLAQARGECDTPMPMHVDLSAGGGGEVHIKSSYRRGGRHFALKVAGTYVRRPYGSIVLISVETGETAVYFDDGGYLTDLRTAAVAAMVARELGRRDTALGILGSGVQARLQAQLHAEVLPLERVHVWGRNPARAAACAGDIARLLPGVHVAVAGSPEEVAASATLIATTAGGLEGGLGRICFDALRTRVDGVALLGEAEIFEGVRFMLERHQYLIEPSSAVTVAAILTGKAGRLESPTVAVISGRNVALPTIRRILAA